MYFLPYIFFSPHTPYASATAWSASDSSGNPSPYFSSNLRLLRRLVGADAEHDGVADVAERCRAARTPASCSRACRPSDRSTRAPCAPLKLRQRDLVPVLVEQGEVGGLVTWLEHARTVSVHRELRTGIRVVNRRPKYFGQSSWLCAIPSGDNGRREGVRRMPITIYDVAERAGVSITTVSHSINHPGKVSPRLAIRVSRAIDQLGFVPQSEASARARRGVGRIGVVAPITAYASFEVRLRCHRGVAEHVIRARPV